MNLHEAENKIFLLRLGRHAAGVGDKTARQIVFFRVTKSLLVYFPVELPS
jgi:hypothetical protein